MDKILCLLTSDEINSLIQHHGRNLTVANTTERVERMRYLNKRLKEPVNEDKDTSKKEGW